MSNISSSTTRPKHLIDLIEEVYQLCLKHLENRPCANSTQLEISSLIFSFLCRPGAVGHKIPKKSHEVIYEKLVYLAKPLCYTSEKVSVRLFASQATQLILSQVPFKPKTVNQNKKQTSKKAHHIREILKAELKISADEKDAVYRTAKRLMREKEYKKQHYFSTEKCSNQPLKRMLSLTEENHNLPKEDIRAHLLAEKKNTNNQPKNAFTVLLRKAAPFAPKLLIKTMGRDLYFRFKPVGYFDKQCRILLVEVQNPSDAYTFTFQKVELLQKLRMHAGFENIVDIRTATRRY